MNLVPKTAAEKASKRVLAAARGQTGRRQMVPGMALGGNGWNPSNPADQPPGLPMPPAMPTSGSPAWDAELVGGMAQGGERKMAPVRRGVWDGRKGGEVPEGPRGVDTVPALTQAGPVFLDSQPGAHEYVLTPEMTQALGGTKRLDALRQLMDNRDQVEARRTTDGTGGPGLATAGPITQTKLLEGVMPPPPSRDLTMPREITPQALAGRQQAITSEQATQQAARDAYMDRVDASNARKADIRATNAAAERMVPPNQQLVPRAAGTMLTPSGPLSSTSAPNVITPDTAFDNALRNARGAATQAQEQASTRAAAQERFAAEQAAGQAAKSAPEMTGAAGAAGAAGRVIRPLLSGVAKAATPAMMLTDALRPDANYDKHLMPNTSMILHSGLDDFDDAVWNKGNYGEALGHALRSAATAVGVGIPTDTINAAAQLLHPVYNAGRTLFTGEGSNETPNYMRTGVLGYGGAHAEAESPQQPMLNPNSGQDKPPQASQPKPLYPASFGPQTLAEAAGAGPDDNVTLAGRYGNAQTPIYKNELTNPKDIATYGKAVFSDSTSGATKAGFDRDYAKTGQIAATPGLTSEQASAQQIQFARDRARLSHLEALRGWQAQPEVSRLVSTPQNAGKPGHLPILSYQTKAALPMWAQQELRTGAFEPQPIAPMPAAQQAQIEVAKLQGAADAEKARIEAEGRANEAEINARKPLAPHYFTNPQTGETSEVYPGGTPRVLEALKSDPPFTSDFLAPMVEKLQPYAQAALSSDPEVAKNAMEQYKAQVKQLRKMAEGTGDSQILDYYLKAKFDPRLPQ